MLFHVSAAATIAACFISFQANAQGQLSYLVKGEEPKPVEFRIPSRADYKFRYDASRITVWESPSRKSEILPDKAFPGRDGESDGRSNSSDLASVSVFVESAGGGFDIEPAVLEVLIRTPDGSFERAGEQAFRPVLITVSPTSGSLGSVISITLDSAIPPFVFGPSSTVEWTGVFQPVVGPPSDPFTITYSTQQVRDSSPSQAAIIIGEGSGLPAIPPEGVPPGTFVGKFTFLFPGHTLPRSFNFQIAGSLIDWFRLDYPEDEFGYLNDPPSLESEPLPALPLYVVPPNGANPEFLSTSFYYHTACVLLLDENSISSAEAPSSFAVDLISFDLGGVEVDRVTGVLLTLDSADGDPDHLTYHSNLATPIVHVVGTIDKKQFPDQIILLSSNGGSVSVMESAP